MASRTVARGWRVHLAAAGLAGLAATAGSAQAASFFGLFSSELSPSEAAGGLARQGYTVRRPLVRRGDVYIGDVSDPYGHRERVIIDARSGQIVQSFAWRGELGDQRANPGLAPPLSPPRPEVDVPPPRVIEAFPEDGDGVRPRVLDNGAGRDAFAPSTDPDAKLKPKVAKPKATATPAPAASATPAQDAPAPAGDTGKPVKTEGVVASTGAPAAPPSAPPAPKTKAINDIPVTPLE